MESLYLDSVFYNIPQCVLTLKRLTDRSAGCWELDHHCYLTRAGGTVITRVGREGE